MASFAETAAQRQRRAAQAKAGPRASAAPAIPVVETGEMISFGENMKAPGWISGNNVPVRTVGPMQAFLGAFVSVLVLTVGLNMATSLATDVCVSDPTAVPPVHTCAAPQVDVNTGGLTTYPEFGLQNIALPMSVFFIVLLAKAASDSLGLGILDAVEALEDIVKAIFNKNESNAILTRLAGFAGAIFASATGAALTWAFLGNHDYYGVDRNGLGTGLGGPALTYLGVTNGESYVVAFIVIFGILKAHTEHVAKQNSNMIADMVSINKSGYQRAFHTIYNIPTYAFVRAAIEAAWTTIFVYVIGTAYLFWTRDLFNMFFSVPPPYDDTLPAPVYNRYVLFSIFGFVARAGGLLVFLFWNWFRSMFTNKGEIEALKTLHSLEIAKVMNKD